MFRLSFKRSRRVELIQLIELYARNFAIARPSIYTPEDEVRRRIEGLLTFSAEFGFVSELPAEKKKFVDLVFTILTNVSIPITADGSTDYRNARAPDALIESVDQTLQSWEKQQPVKR